MTKEINLTNENNEDLNSFTLFDPKLPDIHKDTFVEIVKSVKNELQIRRIEVIDSALKRYINSDNLDEIKLATTLSIFKDLISQEWRIKIENGKIYLAPSKLVNSDNKLYLRLQLQHERDAHLNKKSAIKFIKRLEEPKKYNKQLISIKDLIGSPDLILKAISENVPKHNIIQPYIQIVDKSRCAFTGYKLSEIWRYFRYTWSIPYKSTPGRNIFYLIRDAAQPFHPVIGISALGNSVLQLTKRDNYIGWTLESIKNYLDPISLRTTEQILIKGNTTAKRESFKQIILENERSYNERIYPFSNLILTSAIENINSAINEIYFKDLLEVEELNNPQISTLTKLEYIVEDAKRKQLNNKRTNISDSLMKDTLSPLYVKKRASELMKLLQAKMDILTFMSDYPDNVSALKKLVSYQKGRAITTALQANRKTKIGSNIMEIIVCGAIPPYNELLGGKLVAMLMTSPTVIADYNERYSSQISEIASRMKGQPVIRDSRLAFLGTTSLYPIGSSQYNRIKIPTLNGEIQYKKLGETEGFSSIFFSDTTSSLLNKMLIQVEGGRRINNVFGEGTSPRMRLMRHGLSTLGIPETFIKNSTKRIIYGIELAKNSKEFLSGHTNELQYFYPLDKNVEVYTQEIINFWKTRWLLNRLEKQEILERLSNFKKSSILVSNYINELEE